MKVICNNYKTCTNLMCIHRTPHYESVEHKCDEGDCRFSKPKIITVKCEIDVKGQRKLKLEKINGNIN